MPSAILNDVLFHEQPPTFKTAPAFGASLLWQTAQEIVAVGAVDGEFVFGKGLGVDSGIGRQNLAAHDAVFEQSPKP